MPVIKQVNPSGKTLYYEVIRGHNIPITREQYEVQKRRAEAKARAKTEMAESPLTPQPVAGATKRVPPPHFPKGSEEAKAHMATLRAKRVKSTLV